MNYNHIAVILSIVCEKVVYPEGVGHGREEGKGIRLEV
jgi:hypothetical protein